MLVAGRQEFHASSIVRDAPMLPGLGKGSLQISHRLEESPSASISIIGIPERQLEEIRAAYPLGAKYRLYGMDFVVTSFEDARVGFPCPTRGKYVIDQEYNITVELEGIWDYFFNKTTKLKPQVRQRSQGSSDGVVNIASVAAAVGVPLLSGGGLYITELDPEDTERISLADILPERARLNGGYLHFANARGIEIKGLESGRVWNFIEKQVLDEGSETYTHRPAFRYQEVTGDFSSTDNEDDDDPVDFVAVEPVQLELIDMDDNPETPPADTVVLRDLTSNADESGPTKEWSRTLTINGATVLTEKKIYGFAYTGRDIHVGDGVVFSSNPENFWKVIDYQKVSYNYEKAGAVSVPIQVKDAVTGEIIPVYRDPDASTSASVTVNSGGVTIRSTAEYLTQEITTGFQLTRFQKEPLEADVPQSVFYDLEPDRFNDPVEAARYNLWQFFKNPLSGVKNYELRSERSHYIEGIANPVEVSTERAADMSPQKKAKMTIGATSRNGQIALVKPSQNYVESMLVMAEGENQWSFRYVPHPENTPDDPTKLPFIVGKEVLNRIFRKILIPNEGKSLPEGQAEKYQEKSKAYTAQDPGYDASLEIYRTREVAGRPPQATTRAYTYEQKDQPRSRPKNPVYRYFLTSDLQHDRSEVGGSRSYPNALTLAQAVTAATVDLNLDDVKAQERSKSFTWSYPDIQAGDFVILRNERHFVLGVTTTYEYEGDNHRLPGGKPLVVSRSGLQVDMGLFEGRNISSNRQLDKDASQGGSGSVEVSFGTGGGGIGELGSVSENLQTRRKY